MYTFSDERHGNYQVFFMHKDSLKTELKLYFGGTFFELYVNTNMRSTPSEIECNAMLRKYLDVKLLKKKNE
jgi:hypothetical protein